MMFSFTALAYFLFTLAIGAFSYRFYQYWKKEKDLVSKILFYVCFVFLLMGFKTLIGVLFFIENKLLINIFIGFNAFFQSIALALMAYFLVYVRLKNLSPKIIGIIVFILGLIATILTVLSPFSPYYEDTGAVNWGYAPNSVIPMAFRAFLFVIIFLPSILIFLPQLKHAKDSYTKNKIFGFVAILVLGAIIPLFDFLLINVLKLDSIVRDFSMIFTSSVIFLVISMGERREMQAKKIIKNK